MDFSHIAIEVLSARFCQLKTENCYPNLGIFFTLRCNHLLKVATLGMASTEGQIVTVGNCTFPVPSMIDTFLNVGADEYSLTTLLTTMMESAKDTMTRSFQIILDILSLDDDTLATMVGWNLTYVWEQ